MLPFLLSGWISRAVTRPASLRVEKSGLDQREANSFDLGCRDLHQRRPHHRARQLAEQHERLLHAVVHVDRRIGVEHLHRRIDAIVETFGLDEIVGLHGAEQARLQIMDDAAAAREKPVAAEHQRRQQPRRMRRQHGHRPRQRLQVAHMPFVLRNVVGPVLDGADRRHLVAHPQQRLLRIALAGRERILENDQRQIGRIRDALEMRDRHLGILAHRERRRRKHQQRGSAAGRRHLGDARGFEAAVGPDAMDQRQSVADLVLRDLEHPALLLEGAGGDFGRMRVDGQRRNALGRRDVADMAAERSLVDRQIVVERQQYRRDNAVWQIVRMTRHSGLLGCRGDELRRGFDRTRNVRGSSGQI